MIKEGKWSAPDPMSAECEVADFLAAFVRLAKPKLVVETGHYHGHTARAIGRALRSNGEGTLVTCDIDRHDFNCDDMPVYPQRTRGTELISRLKNVDIAFLDSGGEGERVKEAKALIGRLSPVAWVFLHDALHPEDYREIIAATNWPSIVLPYGRGLAMFFIGQDIVRGPLLA